MKSFGLTKRGLQIVLGLLWVFDGLLQLQHQMFTPSFTTNIISSASVGQPQIVAEPIHFVVSIFLLHPVIFNSLIAITQLGIGALILWKRTDKLGLICSVLWGIFVWSIGEGYGGIFGFQTSLLMGAPGAALIYAILALSILLPYKSKENNSDPKYTSHWLPVAWIVIWVGGAIYQLLPSQNSVFALSEMISSSGSNTPGWMFSLDTHVANFLNNLGGIPSTQMHMSSTQMLQMANQRIGGIWFIIIFALLEFAIGLSVLFSKTRKLGIVFGIIISLIFWLLGQHLSGYYTGTTTDPNTGPLLIITGLAIFNHSQNDIKLIFNRLVNFRIKIERALT